MAVVAGLLVGGALMGARMLMMMGGPRAVTQTYDGVFHLNAVRLIQDSGSASAWTVGSLARAPGDASFYPSAWHQTVSVVAMLTGGDIVVATNTLLLVVCTVVWPLGVVLLVRTCTAAGPLGLFAAGVLSAAPLAFPMSTSAFGVLLPFTLSLALVPPGMVIAARLLGLARPREPSGPPAPELLSVRQALAVGLPVAVAIASAHPQGAIALAVIAIPLAIWSLCLHLERTLEGRGGLRGAAVAGSGLLAAAACGPPMWRVARPARSSSPWLPEETAADAWRRVLALAPAKGEVWVPFGAVFLVCAVAVVLLSRSGWLVAAWSWLAPLAVASLSMQDLDDRYVLTGPWYTDPHRLTALPVLLAVPILAVGLDVFGAALRRSPLDLPSAAMPIAGACAVAVVLCAAVLAPPTLETYRERHATKWQEPALLDADERAVLAEVPQHVWPGETIAVDPWDGSALASALSDRPVTNTFPAGPVSEDVALLGDRLHEIQDDPQVCDAAAREGVRYALDFGDQELNGPLGNHPGIDAVGDVPAAATEVARRGDTALLRLQPCTRSDGSTWG